MVDGLRITDLPALSGSLALDDLLEIVDVSDTSLTPSGASKSISVAQLRDAVAFRLKDSVRCLVATPITLATGLVAGAVVDGVTLVAGMRVLVVAQADQAANGIYVVAASGPPSRSADFAVGVHVAAALVPVESGSRADTLWMCTSDTGSDTVGTDSLTFALVTGQTPPFDDTTPLVRDAARPTTRLRFDLQALTGGVTRTITAPDANLDLANPVFTTAQATTLTAGSATFSTLASGPANATSLTVGNSGTAWVFAADGVAQARGLVPATRTPSVAAGVATLDWRASSDWDVLLDTAATISFANAASGQVVRIRVGRNSAGTTQPTWTQTIDWAGGAAPTLGETAGAWLYVWVRRLASGYEGGLVTAAAAPAQGNLRYQQLDYGTSASQFDLDARFADYFDLRLSSSTNTLANTVTVLNAQVGQQFLLRLGTTSGVATSTTITRLTWAQTIAWLGAVVPPLPNNPVSGTGAPGPVIWVMLVCTGTNTFDGRFVAVAASTGGGGGGLATDSDNIANATSLRPLFTLPTGVQTAAAGTVSDVLRMLHAGATTAPAVTIAPSSVTTLDARDGSTWLLTYTGTTGSATIRIANPRVGQRIRLRLGFAEPSALQSITGVSLWLLPETGSAGDIIVRRVGHAPTSRTPNPAPTQLVSPHNVPLLDGINGYSGTPATWVELLYVGLDPLGRQQWDVFPTADRMFSGTDIRHGTSLPLPVSATVTDAIEYLRVNGVGSSGIAAALAGLGLTFENQIRTRSFGMQSGIMHRIAPRNLTLDGNTTPYPLRIFSVIGYLPATANPGDRCGIMIVDSAAGSGTLLYTGDVHDHAWSARVAFHDSEVVGAVSGVGGTIASPSRALFYGKPPVLTGPGRVRVSTNPDGLPGLPNPLIQDFYVQNTPETCGLKFPGEFLVFRYDRVSKETEHGVGGTNAGVGSTESGWVLEHWKREPLGGRVGAPLHSYNGDTSVPAYSHALSASDALRGWVQFGAGTFKSGLATYEDYPNRVIPTTTTPIACGLIPWGAAGKTLRVRYAVEYAYQTGSPVDIEFTPMWTTPRGYGLTFLSQLTPYSASTTPAGTNDGIGLRSRRVTVTDLSNVQHVRYEEEWVVPMPSSATALDIPGLRPDETESRRAWIASDTYYKTVSVPNNAAGTNRSPNSYWTFDTDAAPFLGIGIRYRPIPISGSVNSFTFSGMSRVSSGLQGPLEPSPWQPFTPATFLEFSEESAAGASVTATSEIIQETLPPLSGAGVVVYADAGETWGTRVVTGTTGQVTVTNGTGELTDPISIGIAAGYVGQTSITTLGTITTGTWQGTPIAVTNGGTGLTSAPAAGQLLFGTGAGALEYGYLQGVTDRTVIDVVSDRARVDIAAGYVGQASITTLGTIATGTWHGTAIAAAYGGTGSTTAPVAGQIAYCQADGAYVPAAISAGAHAGLTVTAGGGGITVDLAQALATTSTPTFAQLTLTNAPTADTHAATKGYVDGVAQGLDIKDSCRVATTANLAALSGLLTVDTVTLVAGDRVLVKDQVTTTQNGIWVVAAGAWARAADAAAGRLSTGAYCYVSEGSANAGSSWVLATPDPITVGTTALNWVQFNGAGNITDGAGLSFSGSTLSVNVDGTTVAIASDALRIAAGYVGQTSITTLGTITTGTWQGTPIAVTKGGTGLTSAPAAGDVLIGLTGGGYATGQIAGTANRVTVASTSGAIQLSGPQDIHTGATPTFAGLTVNGAGGFTGLVTAAGVTLSSGVITLPVGSDGAPSLTFSGRTTTGLLSPAAASVAVTTGGTRALTCTSGNIGLGSTATAPNARLVLNGNGISDTNVPLQVVAPAGGQAWVGVNKDTGYGLLLGYNTIATPSSEACLRQVHASDPLRIRTGGNTIAAEFASDGGMILGNATTGGSKGNGTLNCGQLWISNARVWHPTAAHVRLANSTTDAIFGTDSSTVIALHPYGGNQIGLWNGSETITARLTSVISLSVSGYSPIGYDVFVRLNAGALELTTMAWADTNTRQANALTQVDGYWVRTSDTTQRLVGSFCYNGGALFSQRQRLIWNLYNRLPVELYLQSNAEHAYITGTWRVWNADSNQTVQWFSGMVEDAVDLALTMELTNGRASIALGAATSPAPWFGGLMSTANVAMNAGYNLKLRRGTEQPLGLQTAFVSEYGFASGYFQRFLLTGTVRQ